MARSAQQDPIEKFRFIVTVMSQAAQFSNPFANLSISNQAEKTLSAGFSEVTLPKVTINDFKYRDNLSGLNHIKMPGLATYEPVSLKRGATTNSDLYAWYKLVNDNASSLNAYSNSLQTGSTVPFQDPTFRKDIIISSVNRDGTFTKHWFLFESFPISYKGGDDFKADANEILIQELQLTYEFFLEATGSTLQDALNDVQAQISEAGSKTLVASAANAAQSVLNLL